MPLVQMEWSCEGFYWLVVAVLGLRDAERLMSLDSGFAKLLSEVSS